MAAKVPSPKFSSLECKALYEKAHAAGAAAAEKCVPVPMVVSGGYAPVMDGVCGFAWVKLPGVGSFAKWMKASGLARKAYGPGLEMWVSAYNQSMAKKEAYAYAFARVLREAGVAAHAGSRMD